LKVNKFFLVLSIILLIPFALAIPNGVVIQQNTNTGGSTSNVYIINSSEASHNDLTDIQGGSASERYHLTLAQSSLVYNYSLINDGSTINIFNQDLNTTNNVTFYNVSASFFFGDGSKLTGVTATTPNIFDQDLNTTNNVTFYNVTISKDLVVNSINVVPLLYNQTDTVYFYNQTSSPYFYNQTDNVYFYNQTTSPYFYNQTDTIFFYNQTNSPYFYNFTAVDLFQYNFSTIDQAYTNAEIGNINTTINSVKLLLNADLIFNNVTVNQNLTIVGYTQANSNLTIQNQSLLLNKDLPTVRQYINQSNCVVIQGVTSRLSLC